VDASGNVGVNVPSPTQARLVVASSAGANTAFFTDGTNSSIKFLHGGGGAIVTTEFGQYLGFGTNDTERLRITSAGLVGVGTSSPADALHLASGNFRLTNGAAFATANSDIASIKSFAGAANQFETTRIAFRTGAFVNRGEIAFSTGDDTSLSEKVRIDYLGRLLIGTSSYSGVHKLVVRGRTDDANNNGGLIIQRGQAPTNADQPIGAIFFEDSSSNSGANIIAFSDGGAWTPGSSHPTRLVFSTTADGASSPTPRMTIPSSGGILVNTTSRIDDGLVTIGFQGSIQKGLVINDTDPANTRVFVAFDINGTTQIGYISNSNNTGVTYSTTSDYRLKENVVAVTDSITRLQQLKPSRFNFIAAPGHTVDGFLAHEVQTVVPEAITGTKDAVDDDGNPVYQGIDQSKLVPLLTAALQEAVAKIESLEARLTAAGI
jgi:hypothetical protein